MTLTAQVSDAVLNASGSCPVTESVYSRPGRSPNSEKTFVFALNSSFPSSDTLYSLSLKYARLFSISKQALTGPANNVLIIIAPYFDP